ncbi:MAG: hypothetical protein ACYDCQ_02280 [Dehalococcoidia bacterium]
MARSSRLNGVTSSESADALQPQSCAEPPIAWLPQQIWLLRRNADEIADQLDHLERRLVTASARG